MMIYTYYKFVYFFFRIYLSNKTIKNPNNKYKRFIYLLKENKLIN